MNGLLLIVTIAGERVAFPASGVESVVELNGITPIPRSAKHIAGLSALRSRVLTVVDCLASLELAGPPAPDVTDAVVIEAEGHPYALIVEQVEDVVEAGEVRPVRKALSGGWQRAARGMVMAGEDLLLLIDPQSLLAGTSSEGPLAA